MVDMNNRLTRRGFGALTLGTAAAASMFRLGAAQDATPVASPVAPAGLLENSGLPMFDIVAQEFTFGAQVPGAMAEGWYVVNLVNESEAVANVNLAKLPEGTRIGELTTFTSQMFNGTLTESPAWLSETDFAGGATAAPGATSPVAVYLTPGTWALFSANRNSVQSPASIKVLTPEELESAYGVVPEGTPQASPVAGATVEAPAGLTASMTLDVSDTAFVPSAPPAAGQQLIGVTNSGSQPHDVVLLHTTDVLDEAGAASLATSFVAGEEVNAQPVGGVGILSAGMSSYSEVTVEPGTYVAFASLPDAAGGSQIDAGLVYVFNAQ